MLQKGTLNNRSTIGTVISIIVAVVIVLVALPLMPTQAQAWHGNNVRDVAIESGEDYFWNYDFEEEQLSSETVDWTVALIYWNHGTVANVYNLYWGEATSDAIMHAYVEDYGSWDWDHDKGTKGAGPNAVTHTRPYGRNGSSLDYSGTWGYYVIATCHYDNHPSLTDFGWTENAEYDLVTIASNAGKAVSRNSFNCQNYEADRHEQEGLIHHYWRNSGDASKVKL